MIQIALKIQGDPDAIHHHPFFSTGMFLPGWLRNQCLGRFCPPDNSRSLQCLWIYSQTQFLIGYFKIAVIHFPHIDEPAAEVVAEKTDESEVVEEAAVAVETDEEKPDA